MRQSAKFWIRVASARPKVATLAALTLAALPALSQAAPSTASRYGIFAGMSGLDTPALSSNQTGVNLQAGVNLRPWYTVGLDYGSVQGNAPVTAGDLPAAKRLQLEGTIEQLEAYGLLPAGYQYRANSRLHTNVFSFGPQFSFPPRRGIVVFWNPGLGALRAAATFTGTDAFSTAVLAQSVPSGHKVDWTPFYGGGAGVDIPLGPRFGIRSQLDINWSHAFNDLTANGSWSYRYSSGIRYGFGRIAASHVEVR